MGIDVKNHVQGMCGWGDYFYITHNVGGPEVLVVSRLDLSVKHYAAVDEAFPHPGGCQANGALLVIPYEGHDGGSVLRLYSLADAQKPTLLDLKIAIPSHGAGAAAITPLRSGGQFIVAALHNGDVQFFRTASRPEGQAPTVIDRQWQTARIPDTPDTIRDSIGLVSDKEGRLFLIGLELACLMRGGHGSRCSYFDSRCCVESDAKHNELHLYEVDLEQDPPALRLVGTKLMPVSSVDLLGVNMRWGSGIGVSDRIEVFATERTGIISHPHIRTALWSGPPLGVEVPLFNKNSGKALAIVGGSREAGAAVVQESVADSLWTFHAEGPGVYRIACARTGKCLEVQGGGSGNRVPLVQNECSGRPSQQFEVWMDSLSSYVMVGRPSGKCIEVSADSLADGAPLKQFDCNGGDNQHYIFGPQRSRVPTDQPVAIYDSNSNKPVGIAGDSEADGTGIEISSRLHTAWQLRGLSLGGFTIAAANTSKCLAVAGDSTRNDAALVLADCAVGALGQVFDPIASADGSRFRIVARASGKCWDVNGERTEDGARVLQYDCNRGDNQKFLLVPSVNLGHH
eukprot:m51a1_g599 putative beta-xylosidase (570) ;mRNA; f:71832-73541